MSNELNEIELRVLLERKTKTPEEVADLLNISISDVDRYQNEATRKISTSSVRMSEIEDLFIPKPTTFRLEKKIGVTQVGTMKVGSKILEILSKGIYTDPWNSLKELVSNSFDADAPEVYINYLPDDKKIIIKDNGSGMNFKEFDEHFTFIVKSDKRKKGNNTVIYNRPLIGKIGIGFIAVSELCEEIRVISTKENSDIYFIANINFAQIRSEEAESKEFYEVSKYTLTNYEKENINEHYTIIELLELRENFINILENSAIHDIKYKEYNPSSFNDLINTINEKEITNIKNELGPLWEFVINFSNIIPIEYLEDGPIYFGDEIHDLSLLDKDKTLSTNYETYKKIITRIKKKLKNYNFKVYFNDMLLKKPIKLPHQNEAKTYGLDMIIIPIQDNIESRDDMNNVISNISFQGYFYYQRTRILPEQFRGLGLRIKNVSIGGTKKDFLGHPFSGDSTYFPQTYGEIYIEEGLEEAMNIDRSTFKTSHFEFSDFRTYIHQFLRQNVFQKSKNMYALRKKEKSDNTERTREEARINAVKDKHGKEYRLTEVRKFDDNPVVINDDKKTIQLNPLADQIYDYKKDDRLILQDVAIALETALKLGNKKQEIRTIFWDTLKRLTEYRKT